MNEDNDNLVVPSCMSVWMFVLYLIGFAIVGQVVWDETGIFWDAFKAALLWPITAAVMVAAGP